MGLPGSLWACYDTSDQMSQFGTDGPVQGLLHQEWLLGQVAGGHLLVLFVHVGLVWTC